MDYIDYHIKSSEAKDIDPSNDCLRYVADRFELNIEQRYWLAFLFGTCYSATMVYYVYNEFPDYENVNVDRLQRWWDANKNKTLFQDCKCTHCIQKLQQINSSRLYWEDLILRKNSA